MVRNSAFVFIKPHAVTDKVKDLVKEVFEKNDIAIKKEGELEAEEIDKYKKIDKHYYAIASKATILTPDKLAVPKDKFKDKFGLEWDDVLKDGKALNAIDACSKFEIDAAALDKMWGECKKADNLVKFGGGFYCGKLTSPSDKETYYVFNGFFMSMRSKFVEPGAKIFYYVVEWESTLCWSDFRAKVLGPTDPATAPKDSLRGMILQKWKALGLKSEPNTGDNGVHASASPFEALSERANWLGYRIERDPFGKVLLKAGISAATIRDWCKDPQVTYGPLPMTTSLYDALEDTDTDWCAAKCKMMAGETKPKVNVEAEITKLKKQLDSYKSLETAVHAIQTFMPPPKAKAPKAKAKPEPVQEKPPLRQKAGGGKGGKGGGKDAGRDMGGKGKGKSGGKDSGGKGKGKGKSGGKDSGGK